MLTQDLALEVTRKGWSVIANIQTVRPSKMREMTGEWLLID